MPELVRWLRENPHVVRPDVGTVHHATRHLTKMERKRLFSLEIEQMRTAEGRWFEGIIYEKFLELGAQTDAIGSVILKGDDARFGRRAVTLGQNGIFYSRLGDITVRGNGQDLAEFDLLLVDETGRVVFGEVVTSPSDMKEFEKEIAYKKRLLGYLFNQQSVPFILVSSMDLSQYAVVKRLMRDRENIILMATSCSEIKGLLGVQKITRQVPPPRNGGKFISALDLSVQRPFDYQKFHDGERNRVFAGVSDHQDIKNSVPSAETGGLVKKILYGTLYPSAVKKLCSSHDILIKGKLIPYEDVRKDYSKVVLATDLPGYEPLVYLRSRQKREYLKMVQDRDGNFKFERFTPSRVGFFLWLESLTPTLGSRITTLLLEAFSPHPVRRS